MFPGVRQPEVPGLILLVWSTSSSAWRDGRWLHGRLRDRTERAQHAA